MRQIFTDMLSQLCVGSYPCEECVKGRVLAMLCRCNNYTKTADDHTNRRQVDDGLHTRKLPGSIQECFH